MYSVEPNCRELFDLTFPIERGLRAPLEGIDQETLNYSTAPHKMSIGQLAVHCMGWAQYFLSEKKWKPVKWTCIEVNYPLTLEQVNQVISAGFKKIRDTLRSISDAELEVKNGKKGPGYIIYRLLIHAMVHANQMAYLCQSKNLEWEFGSHFGDMASAIIATRYHTSRDFEIGGF